jgi:hypothetical protein
VNDLLERCGALLAVAAQRATGHPCRQQIDAALSRLDGPLRVAVAGRVKAGKSTLVNAMVGELVAATDAQECTKVITWYHDGVTYRVDGVLGDETTMPLRFDRQSGLRIDLGGRPFADYAAIHVTWPSPRLREITLVDTPGVDSLSDDVAERTERFLGATARESSADAVLYLLRHVHRADVRFLEAFHDSRMAAANPVNSLGVLSRADEIGACRLDAMASAERIAARWRLDPRLLALVQTVVPVAGLLAEAATTLREHEFRVVAAIAAGPAELVDELLVSTDRFATSDVDVRASPAERAALLERLGLYGCRVAVDAVRARRAGTASGLAEHLLHASGMPELRAQIAGRFGRRRQLLKARSALSTASAVAVELGDRQLAADVERVTESAHEFAELRILNAIRLGLLGSDPSKQQIARRLLGDDGDTAPDRLGVPVDAPPDELHRALTEQLDMWRRHAERPLCPPHEVDAARVLARTCEGWLVAITSVHR